MSQGIKEPQLQQNTIKHITIVSMNRSGASLLARLFDGHPAVASYPMEFNFPWNRKVYPFLDHLTGSPQWVPDFNPETDRDLLNYFGIPETKPPVVVEWGKETADPVGVRKNYLGREFYQNVKTDFDYALYVKRLKEYGPKVNTVREAYEARHRAYFEAWDEGKHAGSLDYVVTYGSGELYISNFDRYFREFEGSFVLCPLRDVFGYIASEKTRLMRRYYGSKRFPVMRIPNVLVKHFREYNLPAMIRSWQVGVTRMVLLQEKFGVEGPFIFYRYENLLNHTEEVMKALCGKIGMRYEPSLLKPTIADYSWGGSSHQGRKEGVAKELASYYPKVLRDEEINLIRETCGALAERLSSRSETPLDLTRIPKELLLDYGYQKRYIDDEEKLVLYTALAHRDRRLAPVRPPNWTALAAWVYSRWVRVAHWPRMLRMKYFPGWGRQNYT